MGVGRFDKWLARPTTLRLLPQLVGHEGKVVGRRQWQTSPELSHQILPVLSRRGCRRYGSVALAKSTGDSTGDEEGKQPDARNDASTCHEADLATQRVALNTLSKPISDESFDQLDAGNDAAASREAQLATQRVAATLNLYLPSEYISRPFDLLQGSLGSDFAVMTRESEVHDKSLKGTLLIDYLANEENWTAWAQILRFNQRIHGQRGVAATYRGMRIRNINLPVEGEDADVLWNAFIDSGISESPDSKAPGDLFNIYRHATFLRDKEGKTVPGLYVRIVGRMLRVAHRTGKDGISPILGWHHRLVQHGWYRVGDARKLMTDVLQSSHTQHATEVFREIYQAIDERDYYEHCIPIVQDHDRNADIGAWHDFFVSHNDLPDAMHATESPTAQLPSSTGARSGDNYQVSPGQTSVAAPAFSRSMLNSLLGEVHDIKPKLISDSFCAKLFATTSFSVSFVIKTLTVLGVDSLGPLSLRELALRTSRCGQFSEQLGQIKKADIQLADCMYTRLLRKLANDRSDQLFQAFIHSDQHPENYEDVHVQKALLNKFLETGDGMQVRLTLMCLQQADYARDGSVWNRILQYYAKQRNWTGFTSTFRHIQSERMKISMRSLNFIYKYVLPKRKVGNRPAPVGNILGKEDRVREVVLKVCMYAAERGRHFPVTLWIELLKRYGMEYNMDRVESITLWLTEHCRDGNDAYLPPAKVGAFVRVSKESTLRAILNDNMLRAIIMWGVRDAGRRYLLRELVAWKRQNVCMEAYWRELRDRLEIPFWARGLLFLTKLRALGVQVKTSLVVTRALKQQLWVMYGPSASLVPMNARIREANALPLAHYVFHARRIWNANKNYPEKEPFEEPDLSLEQNAFLYCRVFGEIHIIRQKTREYADVSAWVASGGHLEQRHELSRHTLRDQWERSSFRVGGATGGGRLVPFNKHRQRRIGNNNIFKSRPLVSRAPDGTILYTPPTQLQTGPQIESALGPHNETRWI